MALPGLYSEWPIARGQVRGAVASRTILGLHAQGTEEVACLSFHQVYCPSRLRWTGSVIFAHVCEQNKIQRTRHPLSVGMARVLSSLADGPCFHPMITPISQLPHSLPRTNSNQPSRGSDLGLLPC